MSDFFGSGHRWNALLRPEAFQLTLDYLREPHRRIVRTLENLEIDSTRMTRSLVFEFDAPLIPHLFPVLNMPIGTLVDTLHVAEEDHILPFTLTRSDAVRVSYLALSSLIPAEATAEPQSGPSDQKQNQLLKAVRDVVEALPSMAVGTADDLAEIGSALGTARRLSLSQGSEDSPLSTFRDDHVWRMFKLFLSDRVVYVPIYPEERLLEEVARLKVGVTYEQDLTSSVYPGPRTAFRLATGHAPDDYLVALKGAGRSRSYHFRLRGESGTYVRSASRLALAGEPLLIDGHSVKAKHLQAIRPDDELGVNIDLSNAERALHDRSVPEERPARGVDNLAHIYVNTSGVSVGRSGAQAVQFARVKLRERPAGYSASVAVRAVAALGVVSTVGVSAPTILAEGTAVAVPVSAFFAVPALLALNQKFEPLTFAIANLTAYVGLLVSLACGMIYLSWAAVDEQSCWSVWLYSGLNAFLGVSLAALVICSGWNAFIYSRKRPRVAH